MFYHIVRYAWEQKYCRESISNQTLFLPEDIVSIAFWCFYLPIMFKIVLDKGGKTAEN